ncbi:sulfotransferase [Novosphingobium pentaromativorans US6-1]|uniref:Sulfotransferase n=2 Tax=Novosphingobium pentaromativorans TaxID=205844 RepID=G6E890_9SPHN|nr:sulfotransferase [Novosphingobium pentaromativorans US6-1]EHJ62430.1 hypothetical protein NSU_0561 [Novosphingobium pentaromativorans US6-1]
MMADARSSANLSDFGDEGFLVGLNRFIEAIENELEAPEAIVKPMVAQIHTRLVNLLEMQEWSRTHPEVGQTSIESAVSITGLPRTGTTALANILSLDEDFRSLRSWEQSKPVPPPVLGDEENDPRRVALKARYEAMARENPQMMAMHLWDADAGTEDVEVLSTCFMSQNFILPIPEYHAWWRNADLGPTFAFHRRFMELLQSRRPPGRWLFKAPAHCFHLDALFSAYPEARIVWTHRDPAKAVPSAISFVTALMPKGLEIDISDIGRRRAEHLREGMERALASRERIGEDRFFDLHHHDFIADPLGSIERIYDFLGFELRPEARRKMEDWYAANRSGAHGTHSYTPEQFGLTAEQIRKDFAFYTDRFGIE